MARSGLFMPAPFRTVYHGPFRTVYASPFRTVYHGPFRTVYVNQLTTVFPLSVNRYQPPESSLSDVQPLTLHRISTWK